MKRFTERRGDGVRYDTNNYTITCYPKNNNLSNVDKMAVRLCELEDKLESGQLVDTNYHTEGTWIYRYEKVYKGKYITNEKAEACLKELQDSL